VYERWDEGRIGGKKRGFEGIKGLAVGFR